MVPSVTVKPSTMTKKIMWHFLKVVSVSGLLRACWGTLNLPTLRDQDSAVLIAKSHALSTIIVPGIVMLNLIVKMILSHLWNTSFKLVNYTVQRYQFSPSLNHTVGYRRGQFSRSWPRWTWEFCCFIISSSKLLIIGNCIICRLGHW